MSYNNSNNNKNQSNNNNNIQVTNKVLSRLQKNKENKISLSSSPTRANSNVEQPVTSKRVSFNEDHTLKTRYPLPKQIREDKQYEYNNNKRNVDYNSKLRKKRRKKRRERKIAAWLRHVILILTNQILLFVLLAIISILCIGTTVIISYVEGQRMGKSSQSSIVSSILNPLQSVLKENSDWIEYFTESLTVGHIICNATKNFLLSQSYISAKTKLLQNNPNFYSQTNLAAISSNTAEKQFKLNLNETNTISNSFYRWANGYITTADQLRYLSHSSMEMIKIENKIQPNNKTATLIQTTGLVDRSDTGPYIDYLKGSYNERTWFSYLDLKRGKTYSEIQVPYVQLARSFKSILCDLTESEWKSFNMTLIKDRVTNIGTNGKQKLFAGYMIGTTNLQPFFSQLKQVVPENSALRVMIINMLGQYYFDSKNNTKAFLHYIPKYQNISSSQSLFTKEDYDNSTLTQLLEGSRTKRYDPLWFKGRTLYYTDFSTDSETYIVIVEEQLQDVIFRGFYCIVDGLFVFFMFVNFVMIVFIFQRDKIEKLLNSTNNLKTAMTENQQQLIKQRNMYEIAYYSLIPESILMKNQNGIDTNYYEEVKDVVFVNLFMDFKVTQLQQCICQNLSKDKDNDNFLISHEVVKHKPLSPKRLMEYTSVVMDVLKELCWFHGFNIVDSSSNQLKCYRINTLTNINTTNKNATHNQPTLTGNSSSQREDVDVATSGSEVVDDNTESKSANSFASLSSSQQTPTSLISPSKSLKSLTSANLHWIIDTPYKCYEHIVSAMYLAFSIFYITNTYGLKFKDEDGDEDCYAVIPFPKISIAMLIGDSDFTIIDNGIPCLHVFGEATSKLLKGMIRQEVICKRETREEDCLLLSDVLFTKIQIISSIMNDRVRLVQKESENLKFQMEQKVFNLVAQLQNNLTPRNSSSSSLLDSHQERLILNRKKDLMFHRLLIAETQKVFDEIKEKDSLLLYNTFFPREILEDLIIKTVNNKN